MPRFRFEDYVHALELGDIVTRSWAMERFGVGRSTARYHLERAVSAGALNKQYGWAGKQSAWLYALPETLPRLAGT